MSNFNSNGFGIQQSGFIPKLESDCFNDIVEAMRQNVDPNFDMSPTQAIGQMGAAVASEAADLWELGAALYSQLDPNNAEGFLLDADCSYTGTQRNEESFSTVVGSLTLAASSTVSAGSIVSVNGQPLNQWQLLGPANPTTGLQLSNGPVVSTSAGTYYGFYQSTTPGPQLVNAGQLTVIVTPASGFTAITNAAGCTLGTNVESDSALNVRRSNEVASAGNDTVDALEAALLQITVVGNPAELAVKQAFVYENDTELVATGTVPAGCPAGVPAHSMYVVVYDGVTPLATNAQIAQAIWNNKPSGTQTYGSSNGIAIDSEGNERVMNFDRATITPVYIALTTTRGPQFDPVNGPEAIGQALVEWWATQQNLAVSVIYRFIGGALDVNTVLGLEDMPTFYIGLATNPTGVVNLVASPLQVYTLNTGLDGSSHPFILVDGVSV
jgi:hypothetical protein